jgi:hypothetical protein
MNANESLVTAQVHMGKMKQLEGEHAEVLRGLEEARKREEKKHIKETVELRRSMEDQRAKAVRMEMTKWQKVIAVMMMIMTGEWEDREGLGLSADLSRRWSAKL